MCSERIRALSRRLAACLASGLMMTGCVERESAVEADFGSSVRAMIEAQTAPPDAPGPAMDGQKSQRALGAYRENVSSPEKVGQDIVIRVGE